MKATKPGPVVGKAMQSLTKQEAIMACSESDTSTDPKCGLIVVLVNMSWYDPQLSVLTIGDGEYTESQKALDDWPR